tara:strand:- start:9254 stop:10360 length:1107 start_codon:yes stop_codon:yes gene_type:complete
MSLTPIPTLMIIPTGVGCAVGGYAGDAIPSARLLAAASGCLITHPNVMNGAVLFWNDSRIHYVEGYGIDSFASGKIFLRPVRQQKIGLILDAGLEDELCQRHLQVVDACKATLGLDVDQIIRTEMPLEISLNQSLKGVSWGNIGQPEALLKAGKRLKGLGATAIAVVTRFPDNFDSKELYQYRRGKGVDALAGAEAVISHLLVKYLELPCAHSPGLAPLPIDCNVDPRAASEELGYTFLPSVLMGLSRAPDLVPFPEDINNKSINFSSSELIRPDQLGAVVAPEGALGSEAVLACLEKAIPLIAVANPGVMNVTSEALGIVSSIKSNSCKNFFSVRNYSEAAGIILALREGINISSLNRPIKKTVLDL